MEFHELLGTIICIAGLLLAIIVPAKLGLYKGDGPPCRG